MQASHLLHSLLYLISVQEINAWVLDSTCDSIRDDISSAMQGAFAMADAAEQALGRTPLDPDVKLLAGWLLGPNTARYDIVRDRLHNLAPVGQLSTTLRPSDDVVIECGMGNWELSGQIITHKKYGLSQDYTPDCETCRIGSSKGFMYAITATRPRRSTGRPSIITLCDQFLKIQTKEKYKATAKLEVGTWQKLKGVQKKKGTSKDFARTPIDMAALLDVVLLHELTHALIAAIDNDPAYPGSPTLTWDQSSPGWKDCVKIKDPRNADSIAFFGLGGWMLGQNPPRYVSEAGDISDTRFTKMKRGLSAFKAMLWSA